MSTNRNIENISEQLENHLSSISDEQFLQEWEEVKKAVGTNKKPRSEAQNLASGRNWLKARLLGAMTLGCGTTLTEDELIRLGIIRNEIMYLLNNFDENNEQLGLKKEK